MKKIIYIVLALAYSAIGIIGDTGNSYIEKNAGDKLIRSHGIWFFLVSILAGAIAAYFFTKVFSGAYTIQRKGGKILIPVLFVILSFALTIGVFKFINSHAGKQTPVTINGRITNKWYQKGKKGTRVNYLKLRDTGTGEEYEFRVKQKVYDQLGFMGSSVEKEFLKGSLGIMYRASY